MIKFTIITVCYNAGDHIRKTIESVLHQTYSDIEFIIIDGSSTDNTLDIIDEYANDERLTVVSKPDAGIYNAMNRGISKATGDYVYFLNAGDILYEENVIENVFRYLVCNKADIVIGNYVEKKHEISKVVKMNTNLTWKQILEKGNGICHQAVITKIDCLRGGFDESYKIAADFNWLCEQVSTGYHIQWIDITISEFESYGVSSLAKNWISVKEECRQIVEKRFPHMKDRIGYEIDRQYQTIKNRKMLECLNDMLALKQRNKSIVEYFRKHSINKIAIYGFQYLGQRLLSETDGTEIQVKYIIDRDHSFHGISIPFLFADDNLESVDAIIVTPIFEFYDIRDMLQDEFCGEIISIEDIINSLY